ncbi:hypothetical protein ZOSMA_246G00210 [Zostera marina]|uniref:Hydroxyproline-rich glycoprotein family protein n=1 Tax=Zostera marina TaxID=29655 RepID=A0A0K9PGX8_ZOSMR|nr:hypothetical protein ZOSMA_246G00210 [Zostera marina]
MSTSLAVFLLLVVFMEFPYISISDNPLVGECPYPCLPPPISGNNYAPTPPSSQSQQGVVYPYPPPPPSGIAAYFYPPPSYGSGYLPQNTHVAPPPPNPILPYFPFYYRMPPGSGASPRTAAGFGLCYVFIHLLLVLIS